MTEAAGGAVELAVRDHGLGVPPDKRDHLFDRYAAAHGEGYRSGIGQGLFISRRIVELHGGEIEAEIPVDGGTWVIVRLPTGNHREDTIIA